MRKKTVLIIDDSLFIRKLFSELINNIEGYQVIGSANDAEEAAHLINELEPDIITLDIEMPKLNGLLFLKTMMEHKPRPVLIITSFVQRNSELALMALKMGAVDILQKPTNNIMNSIETIQSELQQKLENCAQKLPILLKKD